jgi:hypothetical protein
MRGHQQETHAPSVSGAQVMDAAVVVHQASAMRVQIGHRSDGERIGF